MSYGLLEHIFITYHLHLSLRQVQSNTSFGVAAVFDESEKSDCDVHDSDGRHAFV